MTLPPMPPEDKIHEAALIVQGRMAKVQMYCDIPLRPYGSYVLGVSDDYELRDLRAARDDVLVRIVCNAEEIRPAYGYHSVKVTSISNHPVIIPKDTPVLTFTL